MTEPAQPPDQDSRTEDGESGSGRPLRYLLIIVAALIVGCCCAGFGCGLGSDLAEIVR